MLVVSLALAATILAAIAAALLARSGRVAADPIDPAPAEHWLLVHSRSVPWLHRLLTFADRRTVGGLAIVLSLGAVLATALFVGWILDTVDTDRGFARWDSAVAEWGGDHATERSTALLRMVTRGGDTLALLVVMAGVGLFDWVRRRNAGVFVFLAVVGVGISLLNNSLKWLIERERPPVEHLVGSSGSSFPSGHSAAAAACWVAIGLVLGTHVARRWRPVIAAIVVGFAVAVAASRALLGVHWLTDVIAGAAVGWTWFFVVALVFGGRTLRLGDPTVRAERSQTVERARTVSSRPTHHGTT